MPKTPLKTLQARANQHISAELADMHPLLARLYANRGVTSLQETDYKLAHLAHVDLLKDINKAAQRILQAIQHQQTIVIVGDFDADGATSTALMMRVLTAYQAKVNYIVPDRFKYGYGLTPEIVMLAIQQHSPQLLITVDNGISSHQGVDYANSQHIDVVITDHHHTTKAAPNAYAIVNPNQLGCDFPSKSLAGVGVAFYVLAKLNTLRKQQQLPTVNLTQYLDLVALGTVADVAQLDANNRILVSQGIKRIQQGQGCVGIQALLEVSGKAPFSLKTQDLGFILGPRINAAGRMDTMQIGIECLLADDLDKAQTIARQLEQLNQERRQVEQHMKAEALACLQHSVFVQQDDVDLRDEKTSPQTKQAKSIVLYEPSWHQGVIGIVAGRLKETYHRPSIVFAPSDNTGHMLKGSARSIEGIHIRDVIEYVAQSQPHLITHFGGHAMAAGLSLPTQYFEDFKQAFEQALQRFDQNIFDHVLHTDGLLEPDYMNIATAELLQTATPWGQGFYAPLFEGVFEVKQLQWLQDKHLKLNIQDKRDLRCFDAIAFNVAHLKAAKIGDTLKAAYSLESNLFKGTHRLQLILQDIQLL